MSEFKMRPLKTSDIFKMSKILKKMNINLSVSEKMNQTEIGAQFIQRIMENIYMAEDEVNELLGDLVGMKAEDFASLEIDKTLEVISLFKDQKGLSSFFKLAGK